MESVWQKEVSLPKFPPLGQDISTEVLIIGGGLAGLLCAYTLETAGMRCVVAEAKQIMSGVSGRTTAKITSQHGLIYTKLQENFDTETAAIYYRANQTALAEYRKLCANINCDFSMEKAYVYSKDNAAALKAECALVRSFGGKATMEKQLSLPFPVQGAICFPEQAQFHPLKFAAALMKGLTVFEQTPVLELHENTALTPGGNIYAKNVIVMTHFPFLRFRGCYFLKQYQQRSYVLALKGAPVIPGMYLDAEPNGLSFRMQKDMLLLGGSGHRTGKSGGGLKMLRDAAKQYFPSAVEAGNWATQDCMTLDGLPYIGVYGPNQYVATGFQKWGMTTAMVASMIFRDILQNRRSPWAEIYRPSRSILRPQLAKNMAEALRGWLSPATHRCTHLGCALRWNAQEHTWDCPCHGSRFAENGTLISEPAQHGLSVKTHG